MTTSEETQRAGIAGWRDGLDELHARIGGRFRRLGAREVQRLMRYR